MRNDDLKEDLFESLKELNTTGADTKEPVVNTTSPPEQQPIPVVIEPIIKA